jgi:hypothetical protein
LIENVIWPVFVAHDVTWAEPGVEQSSLPFENERARPNKEMQSTKRKPKERI